MATSSKTKGGKGSKGSKGTAEFQIRRVKTKEDRKRPSIFMRLKTDEAFKGYALFEPDPEFEGNTYYEYYDHYDKAGNSYVPCAGERCPFCAANDNPSTRALTAWYFPDAADVKDKIKLFTMNYSTTQDAADEAEDEGGMVGKLVRIKRLSDKGDYKVKITSGKGLTKKQLADAQKAFDAKFPNGLEAEIMRQLRAQMERLKALDAMEDDDDDDEDEETTTTTKSRKGKEKKAEVEVEEDEDEEDEDEDEDEEDDEDEDEADEDEEDEDEDEDEEDEDEDEDEDEEDEDEEEEDDEVITSEHFEIVKTQEKDEILDVKNDERGKMKMWVGRGVEVDYETVVKGTTVVISAEPDDDGDWIITEISVPKPKGGKGGKGKGKGKGKK